MAYTLNRNAAREALLTSEMLEGWEDTKNEVNLDDLAMDSPYGVAIEDLLAFMQEAGGGIMCDEGDPTVRCYPIWQENSNDVIIALEVATRKWPHLRVGSTSLEAREFYGRSERNTGLEGLLDVVEHVLTTANHLLPYAQACADLDRKLGEAFVQDCLHAANADEGSRQRVVMAAANIARRCGIPGPTGSDPDEVALWLLDAAGEIEFGNILNGASGWIEDDDPIIESPSAWSYRQSQENGDNVDCRDCGNPLDDNMPIENDEDGYAYHQPCLVRLRSELNAEPGR